MAEIQEKIKQTANPTEDQTLVDLVCEYLKDHKQDYTPFDARRWIGIMSNTHKNISYDEGKITLVRKFNVIKNPGLIFYLKQHNIPVKIAQQHLSELEIYYPLQKRHYSVLGFPHEKDGFVITSPLIEDWIGELTISFIKGQSSDSDIIHIFHSFWDYLSLLTHLKTNELQVDAIILNSYDCLSHVKGYINGVGYQKAYTWLSNDKRGMQASRILSMWFQEVKLIHIAMNAFYQSFPNLSAWYQKQIDNNQ